MTGFIRVANNSSGVIHVFVSKYNGGDDGWFKLDPGESDNWSRKEGAGGGWEVVGFRNTDDTNRSGRYVRVNTSIIFRGFDDIEVI
ncbi:hypothetical protein TWF730_002485 [Orbilia blumenaviensis]|uniref:Uncharacterized protein n=1 Tax=Orbilia blumenaviensis TaxID=1796055 RepID=A0AAV9UAA9_9PEZI